MNYKLQTTNYKLIVIVGPTASGKTELSIKLAKKFNGEVISADSRQVYKGMDIGTGKVTKKEMQGIPHHLLDVASPKRKFTVVQYQKLALKAINKIHKKSLSSHQNSERISGSDGKIPFLVGGTGFYVQAVVDGILIPEVKPDWKLRKELEKKSTQELFEILKKLDPRRAKTIDRKNQRRLIRALEIVIKTKKPVPLLKKKPSQFEVLIIGIKRSPDELKDRIRKRLLKRLKQGMVAEVKKLRKSGLSWKRLEEFGLEYRYIAQYLQGKIKYDKMIEKIQKESEHFAKRQMTWFKKHPAPEQVRCGASKRIKWVKTYQEAEKLVQNFLKN